MSQNWYYTKDGSERSGPVNVAKLRTLVRSGTLRPSDLVQQEGDPKCQPASDVQGLFSQAKPFNTVDCPKCGAALAVKAPPRSFQQLKEDFLPWYKEKFKWALNMRSPKTYLVQAAFWYPGGGFAWIPVWFLHDTRPLYTSVPSKCPKCSHSFDALAEGKNLRVVPFNWAKAAAIVIGALGFAWIAIALAISSIVVILFSLAARPTVCRHCGQQKNPAYNVCPHCGRSQ